jgi:Flp pilus assembly protein TadD
VRRTNTAVIVIVLAASFASMAFSQDARAASSSKNVRRGSKQEAKSLPNGPIEYEKAAADRARSLLQAGKNAEAERALRSALERWPRSGQCHLLLAYALIRSANWTGAEQEFRRALPLASTPTQQLSVHLGLGAVLEKQGRQSQADEQYACALAIQPELRKLLQEIETERLWPESVFSNEAHLFGAKSSARMKAVEEKLRRFQDKDKAKEKTP